MFPVTTQIEIAHVGDALVACTMLCAGLSFMLGMVSCVRSKWLGGARKALYACCAFSIASCFLLAYAFVTHDFSIAYVAQHTDLSTPTGYLLTALWAGQDGSLLWMLVLFTLFSSGCAWWMQRSNDPLQPYVVTITASVIAFFSIVTMIAANPFDQTLASAAIDGAGLNPLLQNVYMIVHPPALYVGFVVCVVPFSFAIAALMTGKLDFQWVRAARKWCVVAWLFLTIGNALGMVWAYVELGWGGYWAWDPVENASLLPWLTATAAIHTLGISHKRPALQLWSVALVCVTFWLTIFASFLSRSGLIASVHAFAKSELGWYFLYYLIALVLTNVALILWRRALFLPAHPTVNRASLMSRYTTVIASNWVFCIAAAIVTVATVLPALSEMLVGQELIVDASLYNRWMTPIGIIILGLMAISPLLGWTKTEFKGESGRHQRALFWFPAAVAITVGVFFFVVGPSIGMPPIVRSDQPGPTAILALGSVTPLVTVVVATFAIAVVIQQFWRSIGKIGAYGSVAASTKERLVKLMRSIVEMLRLPATASHIAHVGVALFCVGVVGQSWDSSHEASLLPSHTRADIAADCVAATSLLKAGQYTLRYRDLRERQRPNKTMYLADFDLLDRHEQHLATLHPGKYFYHSHPQQPTSEVDVRSTLRDDVYVVLGGIDPETKRVSVQVYVNPLVSWVWIGAFLIAFAGVLVLVQPYRATPLAKLYAKLVARLRATFSPDRAPLFSTSKVVLVITASCGLLWCFYRGIYIGLLVTTGITMLLGLWYVWTTLQQLAEKPPVHCQNCHVTNDFDALFCKSCGSDLRANQHTPSIHEQAEGKSNE